MNESLSLISKLRTDAVALLQDESELVLNRALGRSGFAVRR